MTPGHTHREVGMRQDSRLLHLLRKPLYSTTSFIKARDSRWPYGADTMHSKTWSITLLSLLHHFTGLTVRTKP